MPDYTLETSDGIAVLTITRPTAMNALTIPMIHELALVFDATDADDSVRAVVVTGEGAAFCAGADLSAGGGTFSFDSGTIEQPPPDPGGKIALRVYESRKPVIAAINGSAVGVGLTMTLPMDLRIAVTGATFALPFARLGISPDACSSWFLPRIVGVNQAARWLLSGRRFDTDEAHSAGLIDEIVDDADTVLPTAIAAAQKLIGRSAPVSVAFTRRLLWEGLALAHPRDSHLAESRALWSRAQGTDAHEGVSAFLEKRQARYADRVSEAPTDAQLFADLVAPVET